jgi:hypothetical protein
MEDGNLSPRINHVSGVKPSLTKTQSFSPVAHGIGTGARQGAAILLEFKSPMRRNYWITAPQWWCFRAEC